jgi:hypothetical protein
MLLTCNGVWIMIMGALRGKDSGLLIVGIRVEGCSIWIR